MQAKFESRSEGKKEINAMPYPKLIFAAVICTLISALISPVYAQAPGQMPPGPPGGRAGQPPAGMRQPPPTAPTGPGSGPYAAISEVDPSLPTQTIFRPSNLDALGSVKLPILAFANGGCANSPRGFEPFLAEIASHGFLVIAIGTTPPPQGQTSYKQMWEAIDWAAAQNALQGSKYRGKLDLSKVAVAGQSCGGLQAIEASLDPRVTTAMVCNSGVLNTNAGAPAMPSNPSKDILAKMRVPMAYIIGGPSDIAYVNATDDFKRQDKVPVFLMNHDVGHGGTYREVNGGEFGKVAAGVAEVATERRRSREEDVRRNGLRPLQRQPVEDRSEEL